MHGEYETHFWQPTIFLTIIFDRWFAHACHSLAIKPKACISSSHTHSMRISLCVDCGTQDSLNSFMSPVMWARSWRSLSPDVWGMLALRVDKHFSTSHGATTARPCWPQRAAGIYIFSLFLSLSLFLLLLSLRPQCQSGTLLCCCCLLPLSFSLPPSLSPPHIPFLCVLRTPCLSSKVFHSWTISGLLIGHLRLLEHTATHTSLHTHTAAHTYTIHTRTHR